MHVCVFIYAVVGAQTLQLHITFSVSYSMRLHIHKIHSAKRRMLCHVNGNGKGDGMHRKKFRVNSEAHRFIVNGSR